MTSGGAVLELSPMLRLVGHSSKPWEAAKFGLYGAMGAWNGLRGSPGGKKRHTGRH